MNTVNNKEELLKKLSSSLELKTPEDKLQFEAEKLNLDIMHVITGVMEKNKWTKADLAKRLNTSKSYITQLFNGDKLINIKTLAKIQQETGLKFRFELRDDLKNAINYSDKPHEKTVKGKRINSFHLMHKRNY